MSLQYNISYEVASTIFLIILLFYVRLQYDTHTRLNKEFRKLAWVGLIATVLDVTTAVTISYAGVIPIEVNTLLNTLYFASVAALGYQVMYYVLYYIYRDRKRTFIRFNQILICFYVVVHILNIFIGFFFSFSKDGTYVKGPAYLAVYVAPCYFVMCASAILICNFRRFRIWQRVSIALLCFSRFPVQYYRCFFSRIHFWHCL